MPDAKQTSADLWPMTYRGRRMSEEFQPGLVSAIIPTYNRAGLLEEAMESVWAQSYRPIELIVADDGSTDSTRQTVERFAEKCAHDQGFAVRYFWQENRGCAAARNLGLVESRGEYIQLLDSDDYFPPQRLRVLVSVARSVPGFQVAVTGHETVDEHKRTIRRRGPTDLTADDRILRCIGRSVLPGTALFARGLFSRIGLYREDLRLGVDSEYGIRLALRCDPGCCRALDEPLLYYRVHRGIRMVTARHELSVLRARNCAIQALLREAGLGTRYGDALARRELRWFASAGAFGVEHLLVALEVARSRRLRARIRTLLVLARILGPTRVLRRLMRAGKEFS